MVRAYTLSGFCSVAVAHLSRLDYCVKENLGTPEFCNEIVTEEKGENKHKVWVIIGKHKHELPIAFDSLSQGQERVAKKVLEQLQKPSS